MAANYQNIQKDKNIQYVIKITGANGYYPNQTNPLTYDTDTTHTHYSTVTPEPTTTVATTGTADVTYVTTPSVNLVNTQLNCTSIYTVVTVTGTTPNVDPTATTNEINYDTNMIQGVGTVRYFSMGSSYTQAGTFVPATSTAIPSTDEYKASYMSVNNDIYKSYTDVWGASSIPAGFQFDGWAVYKEGTQLQTITGINERTTGAGDVIAHTHPGLILILIPVFTNTNKYNVSVDNDTDESTVYFINN